MCGRSAQRQLVQLYDVNVRHEMQTEIMLSQRVRPNLHVMGGRAGSIQVSPSLFSLQLLSFFFPTDNMSPLIIIIATLALFPLVHPYCRVEPVFELCSCISSNTAMCTIRKGEGSCHLDEFPSYVERVEIYGKLCPSTRSDLKVIPYGIVILHDDECQNLARCRCVPYPSRLLHEYDRDTRVDRQLECSGKKGKLCFYLWLSLFLYPLGTCMMKIRTRISYQYHHNTRPKTVIIIVVVSATAVCADKKRRKDRYKAPHGEGN